MQCWHHSYGIPFYPGTPIWVRVFPHECIEHGSSCISNILFLPPAFAEVSCSGDSGCIGVSTLFPLCFTLHTSALHKPWGQQGYQANPSVTPHPRLFFFARMCAGVCLFLKVGLSQRCAEWPKEAGRACLVQTASCLVCGIVLVLKVIDPSIDREIFSPPTSAGLSTLGNAHFIFSMHTLLGNQLDCTPWYCK